MDQHRELDKKREEPAENIGTLDNKILGEMLRAEREERGRVETENEKLRQEKEILEEQRERKTGPNMLCLQKFDNDLDLFHEAKLYSSHPVLSHTELSVTMRDQREHLEQEVLRYREQVSALQGRLDSVTQVRTKEPFPTSDLCSIWHIS